MYVSISQKLSTTKFAAVAPSDWFTPSALPTCSGWLTLLSKRVGVPGCLVNCTTSEIALSLVACCNLALTSPIFSPSPEHYPPRMASTPAAAVAPKAAGLVPIVGAELAIAAPTATTPPVSTFDAVTAAVESTKVLFSLVFGISSIGTQ